MRELFPGYYRPTSEEFDILWDRGEIVLDTNVLLNLYRYGERARRSWLDVLGQARERLWLPHQVAREFQANRVAVIADQRRRYEDVRKLAADVRGQVDSVFNGLSRHPTLSVPRMTEFFDDALKELLTYVDNIEEKHTEFTHTDEIVASDSIRNELDQILSGKIGKADPNDAAVTRQEEAIGRLEKRVPPGFRDIDKKGDIAKATGDAVLWLQLLEHAEEAQEPVILVTDERGEDWWWKSKGRTLGPRPELAAEMKSRAGVLFYLYSPDEFLRWAIARFHVDVDDLDATTEETRQVSDWARAKQDFEMLESLSAHVEHLRAEAQILDTRVDEIVAEIRDHEREIHTYSNLPDELANSKMGEKAARRRSSAERTRELLLEELEGARTRREMVHGELSSLEVDLAYRKRTVSALRRGLNEQR